MTINDTLYIMYFHMFLRLRLSLRLYKKKKEKRKKKRDRTMEFRVANRSVNTDKHNRASNTIET